MRFPSVSARCFAGRSVWLRTLARLGPALLAAGLASACSSGQQAATYDLSAPTARLRAISSGQVLVAEPAAVQILSSDRIIVKDASGSISYLGGGQWADQLPRLIQARLIHTFENASQIKAVARPSSGVAGDVQLVSEIRAFQVATPSNEAVVEISAKLVSDQSGRIIGGRIFRARVPVAEVDAANAAHALDEALSVVLLNTVRWVSGSSIRPSEGPSQTAT